jgi:tetratricopeptide (TPR) repeat protein
MKINLTSILLTMMMTSCVAQNPKPVDPVMTQDQVIQIERAREHLETGEYHRAQQIVKRILENQPNDAQAQKLMAEIIDRELQRQQEAFQVKPSEELSKTEKEDAVKTWLERAQALLDIRQYDQALLAAEKVFLYDAENLQASQLIDRIKKKAYEERKGDSLVLKQMYQGEIQTRISAYKDQAKTWIESGKWGAARLAVEKILLLEPEDREALRLYDKIKEHRKAVKE